MSDNFSHLYDLPGPQGRRRILIGSVISAIVLLGIIGLGVWQFADHGQLDGDRWAPFLQWPIWQYLLVGLLGTLQAAALTAVLSAPLGALFAVGRLSRVRPIRWIATAYIEIARTIPVLLLVYLMLFGLPHYGINVPTIWKLVIPLTVANSAVFAEIIRAGVLSLPRGQEEAALGLGLLPRQAMSYVVLPQALRSVTPSLVSQLVSLLKDTSLGFIVAFTELLYRGQVLSAFNHLLIQTFLVVTFIYLVCNGSLSAVASRLRSRTVRRGIRPPVTPDLTPTAQKAPHA
ncbi:amino acid ABC transporter permease [Glaciihabitans sp. UYNi722]|uniref:amino acid ABC transporter permease n=1 Tax=Glaciihabitans sp. UYNi722 TaxID=3156344 RepID=UPI003396B6C3